LKKILHPSETLRFSTFENGNGCPTWSDSVGKFLFFAYLSSLPTSLSRMIFFWILWAIAALVGLVVLCFFFVGLADGTVSATNAGLWFLMLLVPGAILVGSLWLKAQNRLGLAKVVLSIIALPGVLAGLFFLILLISKPRWN